MSVSVVSVVLLLAACISALLVQVDGAWYAAFYDTACTISKLDDFETYPVDIVGTINPQFNPLYGAQGGAALITTVSYPGGYSNIPSPVYQYAFNSTGIAACSGSASSTYTFTLWDWPNGTGTAITANATAQYPNTIPYHVIPYAFGAQAALWNTPYGFSNGTAPPNVCSPFTFCEQRFLGAQGTFSGPYPGMGCVTGGIMVDCGPATAPPGFASSSTGPAAPAGTASSSSAYVFVPPSSSGNSAGIISINGEIVLCLLLSTIALLVLNL